MSSKLSKIACALFATAVLTQVHAQSNETAPKWMRYSDISPNGQSVCFTYKGDVYTVDTKGGQAKQITTHPSYDTKPQWTPDGEHIVFSSDRLGSFDLFVVSKDGGVAKRLTTHSGRENIIGFKDNNTVLFEAALMPSKEDAQFPSGIFSQVYEVSLDGGRPTMFSSMPMEDIDVVAGGKKLVYHDRKGYENAFRKHQRSSIARDIWMADICEEGKPENFKQITTFNGEDRTPMFDPKDSQTIYYLSEVDSTMNVYKRNLQTGKSTQLTHHKEHPVRSLSISKDGKLAYSWNGELYTLASSGNAKPQKVDVSIVRDQLERNEIKEVTTHGASEMSLSPNGKEIVFIRRGDVYVTSVDYTTTKQITNSATQERNVSFSPDGRSVLYASERNGIWQIYETKLVREEDKSFTYANELKEERVTDSDITSFQPQYSPDGKEVAFLEDRTELRVINLKSKKVRTVMDGKYEYSYADGDQWYTWSPDSKWLLAGYIGEGGWNNSDVALVKADGSGEIHNLTESGYSDGIAKWVLGGKAMLWFSDRAGYRSHGSWGAQRDAYLMFFDLEAYEKFRMSKEELSLEAEKAKGDKKAEKKEEKKKDADLIFDLENRRNRIIRLTGNSSALADAVLTPNGDKLYYLTRFEGGYELWMTDLKNYSTRLLMKNVGAGALQADKSGQNIFMCSGGSIKKINVASNQISHISFRAEYTYRPKAERDYMFNHVWQQVKDKFYVEDLHNVDWDMYRENYNEILPHINNNHDFAELLSEMLGELNASHTGAGYRAGSSALPTATLGLFYDENYDGDGLKIAEIIKGSPFDIMKTEVKEGDIIVAIDGEEIKKGMDYYPLLEGKQGKPTRLTIRPAKSRKTFEEMIKPISYGTLSGLLYHRWVARCFEQVEELSGGKIGYVHIKGMDSPSFRVLYSELLGRLRSKEAVIVDTRHNGGGWLHDDVVTLLGGKLYQKFVAHGQYIGNDPFNKWTKPSCMLVCEDNYSNAHGTPWLYKELGLGKLIGTPVPGTMTAVWWETLIDPSIVFGIPQVGCVDSRGNYAENNELQPDILIYNKPNEVLKGKDKQLEAAVKHLLEEVK